MDSQKSQAQNATYIQTRLSQIERLLGSDPTQAESQATELLKAAPGHQMILLFQGIARRLMGRAVAAIEVLKPLSDDCPGAPLIHLQLGLALRENGEKEAAVESIRKAVSVKPDFSDAWLALADILTSLDAKIEADEAFTMYVRHSGNDPRFGEAANALREERFAEAESMLLAHLKHQATDIVAICMLAEVVERSGRSNEAEIYLKECLDLAPSYYHARHNYAVVLFRQNRVTEALEQTERLLQEDPGNLGVRKLATAILVRLREYERSMKICEDILDEYPNEASVWTSLGHMLKTVGKQEEAVKAYKSAILHAPHSGEPYWSLANLKTLKMGDEELNAMLTQVDLPQLTDSDRLHFHFAIGKAMEDRNDFAESFQHYAEGNRLRLQSNPYYPEELTEHVRRCKAVFTKELFESRTDYGADMADPIFVLGLPRSGSTLIEQILSSHSSVEGKMELSEIAVMANSLDKWKNAPSELKYPEVLAEMEENAFSELGQAYIDQTRVQRHLNRPSFVDKKPNNFAFASTTR